MSAEAARTLTVPTEVPKPKVTTKELTDRYSHFIAISRGRRELRLFVNRKLVKTYAVGIGALGFETPAGLYEIESMAANPAWYVPDKAWAGDLAGKVIKGNDPDNPIKARWMGFYDGAGHSRDCRRGLHRHGGVTRLHPHDRPGRDRPLRPRPLAHAAVDRIALLTRAEGSRPWWP